MAVAHQPPPAVIGQLVGMLEPKPASYDELVNVN